MIRKYGIEMPGYILLILAGWFTGVFLLYLTYEFTAQYLGKGESYIRFARFYLPGIFPVAILAALVLARLPLRMGIPLVVALIITSSVIYTQYIQEPDIRRPFLPSRSSQDRTFKPPTAGDIKPSVELIFHPGLPSSCSFPV